MRWCVSVSVRKEYKHAASLTIVGNALLQGTERTPLVSMLAMGVLATICYIRDPCNFQPMAGCWQHPYQDAGCGIREPESTKFWQLWLYLGWGVVIARSMRA